MARPTVPRRQLERVDVEREPVRQSVVAAFERSVAVERPAGTRRPARERGPVDAGHHRVRTGERNGTRHTSRADRRWSSENVRPPSVLNPNPTAAATNTSGSPTDSKHLMSVVVDGDHFGPLVAPSVTAPHAADVHVDQRNAVGRHVNERVSGGAPHGVYHASRCRDAIERLEQRATAPSVVHREEVRFRGADERAVAECRHARCGERRRRRRDAAVE